MELEQIEMFIAAAECGSLSKAAEKLYVTHSTVSRSVAKLEAELGVRLLHRGARGVYPTEAGRELASRGAALLAEVLDIISTTREKGEKICEENADCRG